MSHPARLFPALAMALVAVSSTGLAQRALPVDRLPADTYAFAVWHGAAALAKAQPTNNLVQLWNDPDFSALRRTLTDWLVAVSQTAAGEGAPAPPLTQADLDAAIDLGNCPAIIGFAGRLDLSRLIDSLDQTTAKPAESDLFAIMDATGKEEQYRRFSDAVAARAGSRQAVTTVAIKGVSVTRRTQPDSVSFEAALGPWRISAGRQSVIEDLIGRLQASGAPPDAVTQTAFYQAAGTFRAPNPILEYYVRMPDLTSIKAPSAGPFNVTALLQNLHLDRIQGLAGSIGLSGAGATLRNAILGNTSPGSLFDLFGASTTSLATLPAAPAGSSYSASRLDLGAFYRTVRAALKSALAADAFANVEMAEQMVSAETQMTLPDLFALIEEVATVVPVDRAATDFASQMFVLKVRRPQDLLAVLRQAAGPLVSSETAEGGTTFMSLNLDTTMLHLAVTPQFFIVAPTRDTAREAIARAAAPSPPAGSLAADAGFQRSRKEFPASLTSLAYSDMSKFPWQTFFEAFDAALSSQAGRETPLKSPPPSIGRTIAGLLQRHLRTSASASWKAPAGVFFDMRVN